VGVGGAQIAEKLLQVVLVRVRIPVQIKEIEPRPCARAGTGAGASGERGTIGVLVCVQKDVGAVILVVTLRGISRQASRKARRMSRVRLTLLRIGRAPMRECWALRTFRD